MVNSERAGGGLRFEILGPVRAYRGAEPVDLGVGKQQALLAVLLLEAGRPVPMRDIVAALWNGDPPENGVDVVQRCVGVLRRVLDPQRTSLLALTGTGYVLRAGPETVDVGRFRAAVARAHAEHRTGNLGAVTEQVRCALDCWRDEPLAGLTGPVFESARARLKLERATAAKLLAVPAQAATVRPEPADERPAPAERGDARPAPADPDYTQPVDPWAGHDLFPPDRGL